VNKAQKINKRKRVNLNPTETPFVACQLFSLKICTSGNDYEDKVRRG
jgi:hypothetical protein